MLAAWHRVKYPHLSLGAVASGAPIDFYPGSGVQGAFLDAFVATFEDHAGAENGPGCGRALRSALAAASAATPEQLEEAGINACGGLDPADGSNVAEQVNVRTLHGVCGDSQPNTEAWSMMAPQIML